MESCTGRDTAALENELARGWELTKKLEQDIPAELQTVARGIVASWERAMALVKPNQQSPMGLPAVDSPLSATDSLQSGGSDRDMSKKRKTMHKWTTQVRVCSGAVLEGAIEDGYSWRKYGQKDILGATHPRGYYRCTHRSKHGCLATKQVQRSNDNPTIFDVAYRGEHTCQQQLQPTPAAQLPSERLLPEERIDVTAQVENPNAGLQLDPFSFPLDSQQLMATTLLASPRTSESNHPYLSPYNISSIGSGTQSELSEMVSAVMTSTTNSPIMDLDFGLEHVEFDASFLDASFFEQ